MINFQFIFLAILVSCVALPLYLRLVPPNMFFGFREKRILENKKAWYDINQFFGLQILKGSLLMVFLSVLTPIARINIAHHELVILLLLILLSIYAVFVTRSYAEKYIRDNL